MTIQIGTGLMLVTLGFMAGADGKQTPVVYPKSPDGQPLSLDQLKELLGVSAIEGQHQAFTQSVQLEQALQKNLRVLQPFTEELLKGAQPWAATTTQYLSRLVDARWAEVLVLVVVSSLDQATSVQVVGHTVNSPNDINGLINIGATQNLPASNGKLGLNIAIKQGTWYPYLGITITTPAAAPTLGQLDVYAYGQRYTSLAELVGQS